MSLQNLIIEGGIIPMAILTICLAALIIARFKAHSFVKYIGLGSLAISILLAMCAFISASNVITNLETNSAPAIVWNSIHTACLDIAYGIVIYLVSLIFRAHFKSKSHK